MDVVAGLWDFGFCPDLNADHRVVEQRLVPGH